jgi:hypothetical protein
MLASYSEPWTSFEAIRSLAKKKNESWPNRNLHTSEKFMRTQYGNLPACVLTYKQVKFFITRPILGVKVWKDTLSVFRTEVYNHPTPLT